MNNKKKVTHIVIFENYQEGYSYQENLLSQKHKELGYDVSIIASQTYRDNNYRYHRRGTGEYINEYGISVSVLPDFKCNPHFSRFFDKCCGLYEKLSQIKPDIIFLHNFSGKDVRHVVKYLHDTPNVLLYVDCHSDYFNKPIKFKNPIKTFIKRFDIRRIRRNGRMLLPYAKMFWGTIPWRVQYLREVYKIPEEKTDLLIMGADEKHIVCRDLQKVNTLLRCEYNIPDEVFLIATGGKIDKRKQQHLLMEAVKRLENKNVWLIVFGSPTEEMIPLCENYKNCTNIVQTGWLPSDKAYDIFLSSQLAFFPGTHSVLWEQAAACATPIVTKHWTGMEHINAGGNAILLDNVSVDSIVVTIEKLLQPELYKQMKKAAEQYASLFYLKEIAKKAIGE